MCEPSSSPGWVYAFSTLQPDYIGILKIGKTTATVEQRLKQANHSTYRSKEIEGDKYAIWECEFALWVKDCDATEKCIHKLLDSRGVRACSSEMFRISPKELKDKFFVAFVDKSSKWYDKCKYKDCVSSPIPKKAVTPPSQNTIIVPKETSLAPVTAVTPTVAFTASNQIVIKNNIIVPNGTLSPIVINNEIVIPHAQTQAILPPAPTVTRPFIKDAVPEYISISEVYINHLTPYEQRDLIEMGMARECLEVRLIGGKTYGCDAKKSAKFTQDMRFNARINSPILGYFTISSANFEAVMSDLCENAPYSFIEFDQSLDDY
jgi:hypothetical protein